MLSLARRSIFLLLSDNHPIVCLAISYFLWKRRCVHHKDQASRCIFVYGKLVDERIVARYIAGYTLSLVPFQQRATLFHVRPAVFFVRCPTAYFTVKLVRFSFFFLPHKLFVVCLVEVERPRGRVREGLEIIIENCRSAGHRLPRSWCLCGQRQQLARIISFPVANRRNRLPPRCNRSKLIELSIGDHRFERVSKHAYATCHICRY